MGGSRLMSVRYEESPWPKSLVNALTGIGSGGRGSYGRWRLGFFWPANRLIPYDLAETPGMPPLVRFPTELLN